MVELTTLHAILTVLCLGGLAGLGWAVTTWAFGLLNLAGRVIALVLLVVALLALWQGVV